MAVEMKLYNHTALRFANGSNIAGDTYKVMLLSSVQSAFNSAHSFMSEVSASEISGFDWPTGGYTLTGVAITATGTPPNDAMFDAVDVSVTANGGAIGPAWAAVIYNSTDANGPLVAHISFGEAKTADDTTAFKINWNSNGIITFTVT